MGAMKRFAEQVSIDMGLGGEITDEVMEEAQKRLLQDRCLYCGKPITGTPHRSQLDFYDDSVFCNDQCEREAIAFDKGEGFITDEDIEP